LISKRLVISRRTGDAICGAETFPKQHVALRQQKLAIICNGQFYRTFIKARYNDGQSSLSALFPLRVIMSPALDVTYTNGAQTNGFHHNVNSLKKRVDGFGTRAIHVGSEPNEETGAVIPSISLSTTYKQSAIGVHKVWFQFHRQIPVG